MKKKSFKILLILTVFYIIFAVFSFANSFEDLDSFMSENGFNQNKQNNYPDRVILGNERILNEYSYLIDGKNIGLVTNQTGLLPDGTHVRDFLHNYKGANLTSLYAPEHGIDGNVPAGKYVESYVDEKTGIPVYSIYGDTRKPTPKMLKNVDVLIFDMQDIGSRTYTFISSMYKCMEAAKENNIKIVILDRPNPLSCKYQEGFVLKDEYKSFVGIDNLPMAHGMTIGELAGFFNRNIGADYEVVPMKNYTRDMIWQDTGLGKFPQTSPNIPTLESAFCYMMTGSGDGTGFYQGDKFTWGGQKGLNSIEFANKMNSYNLEGIEFIPENKKDSGGVRINITDYHKVNPGKVGYYLLATSNLYKPLNVVNFYKNGNQTMFTKVCGSLQMGNALRSKNTPEMIESMYRLECVKFRQDTEKYYLYD